MAQNTIRAVLLGAAALVITTAPAPAWDYPGHRMVGAIADFVLNSRHPKAYARVKALLATTDADGNKLQRTLSQVAVFPDCAKKNNEPFCGRPSSDEENAYALRNPHHDKFHFTDVPLQPTMMRFVERSIAMPVGPSHGAMSHVAVFFHVFVSMTSMAFLFSMLM